MKLLSIILLIAFVVLGYNVIKGQNGVMEYRQVSHTTQNHHYHLVYNRQETIRFELQKRRNIRAKIENERI